jgi:phosphopantetheinyl transferase
MFYSCMELENLTGHEAGRLLLLQLWQTHAGGELPRIAVTDRGKPFFPDSPWHFSISHTPRHAFCVLSRCPVGIDAEEADRNISLGLAEKILSPSEKAQYSLAADKRAALLKFWVLKEAAVKLSGEGLRGYPCRTNFSLADPRVFEAHGCVVAILTNEGETHVI